MWERQPYALDIYVMKKIYIQSNLPIKTTMEKDQKVVSRERWSLFTGYFVL